ncbi:MAG TPA: lysophospholipid acyltransferase family protein [Acidobacteriaceae bacterium]|jgi:1-acyl-sn-glycerol-3-phosphate acyltransferase|nr:lysophospholipid acyltransferase family protein [Acidobacteriaceae bacterium]
MSPQAPLGPRPDRLPFGERLASYLVRAPLFFLATAFFGSLALACSLFDRSGRRQHRIAQAWARAGVLISGAKMTIVHPEWLSGEPAVYACNHLSYMDTPAIFGALPFQFRIVARHDLWKLPFIGWYLERSGQVGVDLSDPRASVASLLGAVRTLKSGMPLVIFPEGGRTETGHLEPFMKGPAFMAIKAQVPLVPMALIGTWELLPIHASELHPGPVTLVVSEPIETKGMTMKQADALTARLHERIEGIYYEHSWLDRPDRGPLGQGQNLASAQPGGAATERGDTIEVMAAGPQQGAVGQSEEAGKR